MQSLTARAWLLTFFSGTLQILLFPIAGPVPVPRAALGWIALIPLLLALFRGAPGGEPLSRSGAAIVGYFCGIVWYAGNCYWIYQTMYLYGGLPKVVALAILLLFALYLGLYHALFCWVVIFVQRSRAGTGGALFLMPFVWVAVELIRSRITGFPWDLLGVSEVDNLWLTRLAPYAGVLSLSFVLAAANAALAAAFLLRGAKRFVCGGLAVGVVLMLELGGQFATAPVHPSTSHFAVMLQENIEVGAVGRAAPPLSEREELPLFLALTQHPGIDVGPGDGRLLTLLPGMQPTVLIWPEANSHLRSDEAAFRSALGALTRVSKAPAIVGSLGVDFSNLSPRGYYLYDSASLFDSAGEYKGRYDKVHLVPWGEYIPFKRFFDFAHKLTEGAGDMDPGTRRSVFVADGHKYGVFICYESIFGDEVREFAQHGADVLVNISNDGWYGDTGAPWQHLNMTRMRAIENHRWVLLDTNTGITTAIDPAGQMEVEAPRHTRGAFAFPFEFEQGTTFYTRHGDWFAWVCMLITLTGLVMVAAGFANRRPREVRSVVV